MRTISDAIGRGPIREIPILDEKQQPIDGWSIREPVKPRRVRTRVASHFGFLTNCYPRGDGSGLGQPLRLGDPQPHVAANDNVQPHRWPVLEEYKAKRLGANESENESAWQTILYIGQAWNAFKDEADPFFTPGAARHTGEEIQPLLGDPLTLRGPEIVADFFGRWRRINRRTRGGFNIVRRAVVDGCEMHELAADVRNRAKRAAVGRARLIAALPPVAEEVRLLDLADAA